MNSLALSILRLLVMSSSDTIDSVTKEIMFWFTQLITLVADSLKQVSNLLFRMVFDQGGFGTEIKEVLQAICVMFNWVLDVWNVTGCQILKTVISPIVGFLLDILSNIIGLFGGPREILNFLYEINTMIASIQCDFKVPCVPTHSNNMSSPDGALPVSSRCWADYVPSLDTSDALSCSRSDTCSTSELFVGAGSSEDREVLCNSCPIQTGGYTNQFGCDTFTKKCTCNVPIRDRTLCTSNQECRIQVRFFFAFYFEFFLSR